MLPMLGPEKEFLFIIIVMSAHKHIPLRLFTFFSKTQRAKTKRKFVLISTKLFISSFFHFHSSKTHIFHVFRFLFCPLALYTLNIFVSPFHLPRAPRDSLFLSCFDFASSRGDSSDLFGEFLSGHFEWTFIDEKVNWQADKDTLPKEMRA
jgi:hypothetical protein